MNCYFEIIVCNLLSIISFNIKSDGEDITINFLGARNIKNKAFPTGTNCKWNTNVFKDIKESQIWGIFKWEL